MTIHELKILPEYYDAVRCGDKRFEIRKNDRDYHTGDILRLKEWDGQRYTGEELEVLVRYVYYGIDEYGLAEGYCVLSIDTMMHNIPKGRWDYGTQCSVCKRTIIPPKDRNVRINFCPWCGADMRGGYDE